MGATNGCELCPLCPSCKLVDTSEWLSCLSDIPTDDEGRSVSRSSYGGRRRQKGGKGKHEVGAKRIEELTRELFNLHDLDGNGVLEESELVTLNEYIAILHHGGDVDTEQVRAKYRALFRAKLDPEGLPVPYSVFHAYAREVLDGLDTDPEAQEMILEQFVAEAESGRSLANLEQDQLNCMTNSTCSSHRQASRVSSGNRGWDEARTCIPGQRSFVQPQNEQPLCCLGCRLNEVER